jgi:hypothetical protein
VELVRSETPELLKLSPLFLKVVAKMQLQLFLPLEKLLMKDLGEKCRRWIEASIY